MRTALPPLTAKTWFAWANTYLTVFRVVIVSLCATAAAIGFVTHTDWLLAAGICIGVGELLECTYYLTVLEWSRRSGRLIIPD